MPWHTLADAGTPTSIDRRPYRGMNALWLPMVAAANGWTSGVWATYRGWQRHGAQVRRGERGTHVVLWKPTTDKNTTDTDDTATRPAPAADCWPAPTSCSPPNRPTATEPHPRAARTRTRRAGHPRTHRQRRRLLRRRSAPASCTGGNRACYQPGTDTIHLPDLAQFDQAAHFYATSAHEHVHWTGHADRLARDLTGRFGSDAYAAEELVAELGAAMWCGQAGISATTRADHAAYLAGWLRVLRSRRSRTRHRRRPSPSRRRPPQHPRRPRRHHGRRRLTLQPAAPGSSWARGPAGAGVPWPDPAGRVPCVAQRTVETRRPTVATDRTTRGPTMRRHADPRQHEQPADAGWCLRLRLDTVRPSPPPRRRQHRARPPAQRRRLGRHRTR